MKEKLVTVARFEDYIEADLARQLLEDEGLKAFVMGQNVGNVYSGVPAVIDIELQTPESQAEQAKAILEASKPRESGEDVGFAEPDFADEGPFDTEEDDDEQEGEQE